MIDDPRTIDLLMERIRAALPMRAHVSRDVLRALRQEAPEATLSHQCDVTEVRYAGDEGGILCTLDFDDHASMAVYIVSIIGTTGALCLHSQKGCSKSHNVPYVFLVARSVSDRRPRFSVTR